MRKCIIFGAGFYGKGSFYKLKDKFNIIYYVDNNVNVQGTLLHGIPIISCKELKKIYQKDEMSIVICSKAYFQIANQLSEMGINDYYVMLEGFLYHSNNQETMMPVEIEIKKYFKKNNNKTTILFVQNVLCIRTQKIASLMKKNGFEVYVLYTLTSPKNSNEYFQNIYNGIYTFSTQNAIVDFVNHSEFDIIHSSNEPDILTALLMDCNKPIIYDCHDLSSAYKDMTIEELSLEFLVNRRSSGNIYTTKEIRDEALKKYAIPKEKTFVLENLISEDLITNKHYEKISNNDHELHCVYEGGVVGEDVNNHRYFESIWKLIADVGVHIHFYTNCNEEYCHALERIHSNIHYEGNLGSKELAVEMSKYDVGLCILNVTEKNRQYLEYASPNKVQEYVNAGIPVAVGDIKSQQVFVEQNGFGARVDFCGDIHKQLTDISKIVIEDNILQKKGITLESKVPKLIEFYEQCMKRQKI